MKKLFFIMSLSYLHAYHPIELAQPFCEVGVIMRENLIGPRTIKAQINSFIKGTIFGVFDEVATKGDKTLYRNGFAKYYSAPLFFIQKSIQTIDIVKNFKNKCIIAEAVGFYLAKILIQTYLPTI